MKEITQEEIKTAADLAMLALTEAESAMYQKDLTAVLGYFDKLSDVDTEGVAEMGHITGMQDVYREDEAVACDGERREALLANVPAREGDHIRVKNVL